VNSLGLKSELVFGLNQTRFRPGQSFLFRGISLISTRQPESNG